jgi:hypothetical protein
VVPTFTTRRHGATHRAAAELGLQTRAANPCAGRTRKEMNNRQCRRTFIRARGDDETTNSGYECMTNVSIQQAMKSPRRL